MCDCLCMPGPGARLVFPGPGLQPSICPSSLFLGMCGSHPVCSGLTPGTVLRNHSRWNLENQLGCRDQTQIRHTQAWTLPTVLSLWPVTAPLWPLALLCVVPGIKPKVSYVTCTLPPASPWAQP